MALEDFFGTEGEVDPGTPGLGGAYMGNAIPASFQGSIGEIEALQRPLLERKNKLMEQLYEPDHFSFGGAVAQALVGFLPAILGKTLAGNAGGAIGARAGLEGLGSYDKISKAYRADEQKQQAAEVKTLGDEYSNYEALKKTLLTGGMVRGNQEEQRKYEDTRRRPGGDIYDYERQKMAQQHAYRTSEIAMSQAGDGNNKQADPALMATTKYAIEQRFKDQPELAQEFVQKLASNPTVKSVEEMSRQLGLRDIEKRDSGLMQQSAAALFDRIIKPVEKDVEKTFNSTKKLYSLVDSNTGVTIGTIKSLFNRAINEEVGASAEGDISRGLQKNLQMELAELQNYLSRAPDTEALSPPYKQSIKTLLSELAAVQLERLDRVDAKLKTYAPTISKYANDEQPEFYRDWTMPTRRSLEGLRGGPSAPPVGKQYPPDQEALIQKRLNEKLAAAGRR